MLKRLYVDNFRCLSNFTMEPGRVAALVGANGSGKSTIFDVLSFLQDFLLEGQTYPSVAWRSLTRWVTRSDQSLELDVEAPGFGSFRYKLACNHDVKRFSTATKTEELFFGDQILYRFAEGEVSLYGDRPSTAPRAQFPFSPSRSFLPLLEERPDNQLIMAFKRWLFGLCLFHIEPRRMEPFSQRDSPSILRDASNFSSWYRGLIQTDPGLHETLRADLSPILGGLDSIQLLRAGTDARFLSFESTHAGKKIPLGLDELSDGQRTLVVLYTVLRVVAKSGASLVVFDEPDNFVATHEIQPWLSQMRDAALDHGSTLLVLSHHPEVIDYLAPDNILLFHRDEGGPTRSEKMSFDASLGLKASELLRLEPRSEQA